ncbi:MAG: baseplate protein [Proteobacteria bacterium]|nr:baseplate protein [Pseudomonadota bacterium]
MSKEMKLPTMVAPTYELKLPSSGEKVAYRPFLVKEEKILLMAMESGNSREMSMAIRKIIDNCTEGKLDLELLPLFDVEYIFLQLRAKSVGEIAEPMVPCPDCNEATKIKLDISKIKVSKEKENNPKIQLTEDIGIIMKYPQLLLSDGLETSGIDVDSDSELAFDVIIKCVDKIWQEDNVWSAKDVGIDGVKEFIENLTQEQFSKITKFFETMPQLKHTIDYTCPHCEKKNKVVLRGLDSFFDSASVTTV